MSSAPQIPSAGAWGPTPASGVPVSPPSREGAASRPVGDLPPTPAVPGEIPGALSSQLPQMPGTTSGFSSQPATIPSQTKGTRPPVVLLYGSLVASVLAIILSAVSASPVLAVVSWVLAALVGLGLATIFVVKNAARQANPWYSYRPMATYLYRASVAVAIIAVVGAALRIALFAGRTW